VLRKACVKLKLRKEGMVTKEINTIELGIGAMGK
jgi:hypothetical protein